VGKGLNMAVIQLSDRVYVVPGGVNIGVIDAGDHRFMLVESGLNDTSAKKALKSVAEELDGAVVAVLTTHAHADHFGGDATVVKRASARIYAPEVDEAILRYPLLQPTCLFAGADPLDSLRNNFLLADASPVDEVISPGPLEVEGVEIEVIGLAGHSPNQVGYLVDGVFFCADVVLPDSVLAKYKIPYLHSVTAHLNALTTATEIACRKAVPGYGAVLDAIDPLVDMNRRLVEDVMAFIVELSKEPLEAGAILTSLLRNYDAPVNDASSYYLLHPTVFAFLSHLERAGVLSHDVRTGQSLWQAI
jgi:glyoxylase-like metal-dependent hydrolase (beta-lactamase superfamily II)